MILAFNQTLSNLKQSNFLNKNFSKDYKHKWKECIKMIKIKAF